MLKKWILQQVIVNSLAIIVWVKHPKFKRFWAGFYKGNSRRTKYMYEYKMEYENG